MVAAFFSRNSIVTEPLPLVIQVVHQVAGDSPVTEKENIAS